MRFPALRRAERKTMVKKSNEERVLDISGGDLRKPVCPLLLPSGPDDVSWDLEQSSVLF